MRILDQTPKSPFIDTHSALTQSEDQCKMQLITKTMIEGAVVLVVLVRDRVSAVKQFLLFSNISFWQKERFYCA